MSALAEVVHSRKFFLEVSEENYSSYLELLIVKCIVFIIIIECKYRVLMVIVQIFKPFLADFKYGSYFLAYCDHFCSGICRAVGV